MCAHIFMKTVYILEHCLFCCLSILASKSSIYNILVIFYNPEGLLGVLWTPCIKSGKPVLSVIYMYVLKVNNLDTYLLNFQQTWTAFHQIRAYIHCL